MVVSEDEERSQIEYELKSRSAAQALYRSITEFHTFFQQDKVSNVIKTSGYCKSVFGSFKGQSADRFYFDVTKTHQELVDHLWPILHPNLTRSSRPLPPISSGTYHDSSSLSIASQRSTRSLPSNSPHHRAIRSQNTLQRSISTDNTFRRPHVHPPPSYPPPPNSVTNSVHHSTSRRGSDNTRLPPSSPFFPYASTINGHSDSDTYISGGESDTYVCMRSLRGSETYSGAGSDTYVNSGASEISSSSIENRIPSPPPVYSEIDPNSEIPSPPPRPLRSDSFTITGVLNNNRDGVFEPHDQVLARTKELETELSRLRSAMTCRMCRSNTIGATFCPCGHTVCCLTCAQKLKQCWECDVPIDSVQKIVLA